MVRPKTMIRFALVLTLAVRAQIDLPIGKDLDPYLFPSVDTLYLLEEGLDSLSTPTSPEFADEIRKWTQDPSIASVRVDTANRVLHYTSRSLGTVQRKNGVIVGAESSYLPKSGVVDYTKWLFDTEGRRIAQFFGRRSGEGEVGSDTISYDWTRSGCPDEFWADTKRAWTVDADGRCLHATIYAKSGSEWSEMGVADHLVWSDGRLSAMVEMEIDEDVVDTVAKDLYSHDGAGNWTKVEHFLKTSSGDWRMAARLVNEWVDGKFVHGLDTEYDRAGNVVWSMQLSTVSPWGTSVRNRQLARPTVEAQVVGSVVEFSNPDARVAQVRITDPKGRTVAEFAVPSRGTASWSASRHGILLWSASSEGHRAAGRLVLR